MSRCTLGPRAAPSAPMTVIVGLLTFPYRQVSPKASPDQRMPNRRALSNDNALSCST